MAKLSWLLSEHLGAHQLNHNKVAEFHTICCLICVWVMNFRTVPAACEFMSTNQLIDYTEHWLMWNLSREWICDPTSRGRQDSLVTGQLFIDRLIGVFGWSEFRLWVTMCHMYSYEMACGEEQEQHTTVHSPEILYSRLHGAMSGRVWCCGAYQPLGATLKICSHQLVLTGLTIADTHILSEQGLSLFCLAGCWQTGNLSPIAVCARDTTIPLLHMLWKFFSSGLDSVRHYARNPWIQWSNWSHVSFPVPSTWFWFAWWSLDYACPLRYSVGA